MIYLAILAFGVTLGLPIAVIFASHAQGKAVTAAMEGIARQPESASAMTGPMVIGLALIEAMVIYSLVMFFVLFNKLPDPDSTLVEMIAANAEIRNATDNK